ncbi:hypothetical protein BGZ61DRAFT_468523 [Ilyonectria robusta]|uniref:uncharacterized protein n=1 Tax=Ilyonectria robusta TaxID=1079257 RepID=UPI001E8D164A|nr:uncharacterized protein BGZ61DRAFT_468523 [Ilyonectria robusta]KAH8652854.1 hypothetical protein BGZ61DRAFT_468523 [Ilyonectria robusta]
MASRLSLSQHNQIDAMIESGLSTNEIVKSVGCCRRTVQRQRLKRQGLPTTKAPATPSNPLIRVGRSSYITPYMQEILRKQLLQQSDMFQCEMTAFLYDKTRGEVSLSTMSHWLICGTCRVAEIGGWGGCSIWLVGWTCSWMSVRVRQEPANYSDRSHPTDSVCHQVDQEVYNIQA